MSLCRSFNPIFKDVSFQPNIRSSLKSLINPVSCQKVLDKLELTKKYPKASQSLDVVDLFPGYGLFSTMLNYELKPNNHIIMEDAKTSHAHYKHLNELLTKNKQGHNDICNFTHYCRSGYEWASFDHLIERDKVISPKFKPRDKIHDELLVVANLVTPSFGESLMAQWIMCCGHHNWLQKYGRVKIICAIPEKTAQKFLAGPEFQKRNRSAIKRDVFTNTKLVAISEADGDSDMPDGFGYDPNVLVQDQPVILPLNTIRPLGTRIAFLEIDPKKDIKVNIDYFDYVVQVLMYRATQPLSTSLLAVGPGAGDDLLPQLSHLQHKSARDLTLDDLEEVVVAFANWPFKPTLEDRLSLNPEFEEAFQ